jgi:hypothetical protein
VKIPAYASFFLRILRICGKYLSVNGECGGKYLSILGEYAESILYGEYCNCLQHTQLSLGNYLNVSGEYAESIYA